MDGGFARFGALFGPWISRLAGESRLEGGVVTCPTCGAWPGALAVVVPSGGLVPCGLGGLCSRPPTSMARASRAAIPILFLLLSFRSSEIAGNIQKASFLVVLPVLPHRRGIEEYEMRQLAQGKLAGTLSPLD